MCYRDASSVFCTVVQERASGAALSLTAALQGGDPLLIKKPKFSYTLHAHAAATVIQRAWLGARVRGQQRVWVRVTHDDGDIFFRHDVTGELRWTVPPFAEHRVTCDALRAQWHRVAAFDGEVYYQSALTHEVRWVVSAAAQRRAVVRVQRAWRERRRVRVPEGGAAVWEVRTDGDDVWFRNSATGELAWEVPTA